MNQSSPPVNDIRGCPELAQVIPHVVLSDDKITETSSQLQEMLPNYDDETPVSCEKKRKLVSEEEDYSVEPKSGDSTFNQLGGCHYGESVADEVPLYDAPLAIIHPGCFISFYLCTSYKKYW